MKNKGDKKKLAQSRQLFYVYKLDFKFFGDTRVEVGGE